MQKVQEIVSVNENEKKVIPLTDDQQKKVAENIVFTRWCLDKHFSNVTEDMRQEAMIWLIACVKNFDESLGFKFHTYLRQTIIKEGKKYFSNKKNRNIYVPQHKRQDKSFVPPVCFFTGTTGESDDNRTFEPAITESFEGKILAQIDIDNAIKKCKFTKNEKIAINWLFGLGITEADTARVMKTSREYINQTKKKIYKKILEKMEEK